MIGNDVVDLALAKYESNWQRKGFLDKIFTNNEQHQIHQSENPEELVWKLWSRKEAVYKIYNRQTKKRFFNPKIIECVTDEKVIVDNIVYFTRTEISADYIYSEAVTFKEDFDIVKEVSNPENLLKINGIPFYEVNGKVYSASKSHHGKYEKIIYLS